MPVEEGYLSTPPADTIAWDERGRSHRGDQRMAECKTLILVCAVIVIGLLAPPVLAVEAAPGDTVLFCTARGSQEHPDIDGHMVVWEDGRDGKYIYYSTAPGSGGRRITGGYAEQRYPSVSGNFIVWEDRRHGNWEIYLFSPSGGERRITNSTTNQRMPVVHGDHAVWYDTREGGVDICLYNIETGRETYLDCSPVTEWKPALSDEYVVWEEITGGGDIWTYDILTGKKQRITRNDARQAYPAISGTRIVWEDYRNGLPDIYMYDLDDGQEYRITDDPAAQVSPAIGGDLIAWEDKRGGLWDIYLYDLSIGVEMSVCTARNEQLFPSVSGDRIVWQDKRSGEWKVYIFTYTGGAPPEAEFSADPAAGTIPLTVRFIDRSTGSPEDWKWEFGDGGSSTERNPVHTYKSPGEYSVSLRVSGRFGSDTVTKTGLVRAKLPRPPAAGFSAAPVSGGTPLVVQFTDKSANSPATWLWDFGDGATSNDRNPEHTYAAVGTYSVSLTAGNAAGSANITKPAYITVVEPPIASFQADTLNGTAPFTVRFSDTSTGDVKAWSWRFGDGGTSSAQNPEHTYLAAGTYTVSLEVENPAGSDTETKSGYITLIGRPLAAFTVNATVGTAPLAVGFADASAGDPASWSWVFGDGGSSADRNPVHEYQAPGTYTVSLTVANDAGENTTVRAGYITVLEPLTADFTANVTRGAAPLAVGFADASVGKPASWFWDFGDKKTSTLPDPVHVFEEPGTYTVSLTISEGGNNSTKVLQIRAFGPPAAGFSAVPLNGTAPLTVTFTDTSAGEPSSWLWDFGDGATSTDRHPSHTYTAAGNYTVNLTSGNVAGSSTTVKTGYIIVRPAPATPTPTSTQTSTGGGGGGGGSYGWVNQGWSTPAPTPTPTANTTSTAVPGEAEPGRLPLGETGLVERFVRVSSPDGVVSLAIVEGVRAVDAAGNPLRAVTIEHLDSADVPPVPGVGAYAFAGYACLLGPEGAAFSPPVTLAFNFTEGEWDTVSGGQNRLVAQWYNRSTETWEEVPTTIYPETRSIAAEVSHFSLYALFVEVPGGGAAQVVAAGNLPQPETGPDPGYAHLVPGLLALIIVGAGAYLYYRKGNS
jgi:beta propeller repeat protein